MPSLTMLEWSSLDTRSIHHIVVRAMLELLSRFYWKWLQKDPRVKVVRATVSPDNIPSRSLIAQYDFVEVGEQIDEEDGLEVILEKAAR
jgi:RimJ/RimL family protein N-acetyltransferase